MLYAVEVPPFGGDTIWANAALAYATLSDTMKSMLDGLRVRMSMRRVLSMAQEHMRPDDTSLGRLAATRAGDLALLVLDGEAGKVGGMALCRQVKDEVFRCPPVLLLVGRRRRLLNYMQKEDINRYRSIVERLGLRR